MGVEPYPGRGNGGITFLRSGETFGFSIRAVNGAASIRRRRSGLGGGNLRSLPTDAPGLMGGAR